MTLLHNPLTTMLFCAAKAAEDEGLKFNVLIVKVPDALFWEIAKERVVNDVEPTNTWFEYVLHPPDGPIVRIQRASRLRREKKYSPPKARLIPKEQDPAPKSRARRTKRKK